MEKSKAIRWAARRRPARRFLAVLVGIFLRFAPADDPKVLALCIIRNPQGVYYGGLVAAPVVRELFENILPYLDEIGYYEKNETINRK